MLIDAGGDGEYIGIEDDGLGRKAVGDEQLVGSLANLDLAFLRVGLADLVERHHDDGGAIVAAFSGVVEELRFAFLHADRIDDRLARHAFEARLDHRSEEHTSELQSLMRISYAVFCLKKKKQHVKINSVD